LKETIVADANGEAVITKTIPIGDAKFYSLLPVIENGGDLTASETISGTKTLTDEPLVINSGATLIISSNTTYNCYKNIVVNSGSKLVVEPGATLSFYDGAKLVVEGKLIANGSTINNQNKVCN
jgi:hypothetical protein